MRNLLILAVCTLITAGCFQGADKGKRPEDTVNAFYKALCSGEFEQAESHCDTLGMKSYLDIFRNAWEAADEDQIMAASEILKEISVTVNDIERDGQDRTVFYTLTSAEGKTKEKIATLMKEEGEWKIGQITDRV